MKGARTPELLRAGLSWLGSAAAPVTGVPGGNLSWLNTPIPLFHMVCTNVPGPQIPLYTCGQRMTACYPHVPTGMDVGISVAIESYDQKLYFALTTDALAAPDGGRMMEFLEASFRELREAAGVPATEAHVTRTRQPRKPRVKAKVAKAPVEVVAPPVAEPDIVTMLNEIPASEEELEDAELVMEEELEPVS